MQESYENLMKQYTILQAKDPDHCNYGREWLDFEDGAKKHLAQRKTHLQNFISKVGVSKVPSEAAESHKEEHLVVPPKGSPKAEVSDAIFYHIVLQQCDAFVKAKEEVRTVLEKGVKLAEGFVEGILESLGLKLPVVPWIPFSDFDPSWAKAALVATQYRFTDRAKYYIEPDLSDPLNCVYPLPLPHIFNPIAPTNSLPTHVEALFERFHSPTLRIAIVGDIGTNDKVHRETLQRVKHQHPDLILHLGDIYVSGTPDECDQFYSIYEEVFGTHPEERPSLWSIPGNHEYISAGQGYFERLVNLKKLGYQNNPQKTSYFSLESEKLKLQILAVDTGYNSKNFTLPLGGEKMDYTTSLHPIEAKWAQGRLAFAKEKGWRTIVLSHHQYYSAFWENKLENHILGNQILKVGQPITAWMWGHEHRLGVYDAHIHRDGIVQKGMCIGHGAIPMMVYESSATAVHKFDPSYTPNEVKVYSNQADIYNTGFALLQIVENTKEQTHAIHFDCIQVDRLAFKASRCGPGMILSEK